MWADLLDFYGVTRPEWRRSGGDVFQIGLVIAAKSVKIEAL
jgi:hypothetical protein